MLYHLSWSALEISYITVSQDAMSPKPLTTLSEGCEEISVTLSGSKLLPSGSRPSSDWQHLPLLSLTDAFLRFSPQYSLEKAMATHSSTLAWKIPWMEEPGGLQSMGSQRVRHDWATSLSLFPFMHWRRKWQPTPVFLPGESQGWQSLVGCCLWGCTESDITEAT